MGEPIRPKPSPQPPRPPAPPKPVYASRMERERAIAADTYETWKTRLSNLQINTLTEDEWLKACNHFDGCAMCSSDSIDARGYFIAFKEGGKYNRCNILPLCDKCATEMKYQINPFRRYNRFLNSNLPISRGVTTQRFRAAVDYLRQQIEGAENE